MECNVCGKKVSSWSARYGAADTVFCKDCYETETAKKLIQERLKSQSKDDSSVSAGTTDENQYSPDKIASSLNYQFKTLLGYGKFVSGFGWIIVSIGVIAILLGLGSLRTVGFVSIFIGVISIITGIGFVVFGQLISCFVAIERNTRSTYEMLKAPR